MALDHAEPGRVTDREERVLLVLANVVPLVAYATGSVLLLEALLLYLLEPPIVAVALALKLLVVDAPVDERSRQLLTIDPDWLVRPVRVGTWNVVAAATHVGAYAFLFTFFYGVLAALVLTLVDAATSIPGFEALPAASIAVVALGFAVRPLRDLGQFLWTRGERRAAPDALRAWAGLERNRLLLLSLLYALVGTLGTTVLDVVPGLALACFAVVKTGVDLLYQPHTGAAA